MINHKKHFAHVGGAALTEVTMRCSVFGRLLASLLHQYLCSLAPSTHTHVKPTAQRALGSRWRVHPRRPKEDKRGIRTLLVSAAPPRRRRTYAASRRSAAAEPPLLKPMRFTMARCSGSLKQRGVGLPGCGSGVIEPAGSGRVCVNPVCLAQAWLNIVTCAVDECGPKSACRKRATLCRAT